MKGFLLRGLAAGAAGGVATAFFIRFVTETQIGAAIDFENASGLGTRGAGADRFSRSTQHWGGMAAAVILGLILGLVLALVVAFLHDQVRSRDESGRVLKVAAAAFVATSLLPGLKYPSNPPTVGNPDTITQRTWSYLALVGVCILIVVAARWIWHRLTDRGFDTGTRFLLGGGAFVLMVTVAFLVFPANPDRIEPPNNEATPALVVSSKTPAPVLDAMLANAKATRDEAYRDPNNPDDARRVTDLTKGSELVGTPVAASVTKLVPHSYASLIWSFRMRSWAGIALMWAVMAGVLGLLLDRAERDQPTP